jgi:hypothetical protein
VIAAVLLSVILFPLGALTFLRRAGVELRADGRNEAAAASTIAA